MFTSDNGPSFTTDYRFWGSCGGFRGIKRSLNEGGIRVPMLVRWPGRVKADSVCKLPFAGYDVMATAADLASAEAPDGADGLSFLPALLGRPQKKHPFLFWETHERDTAQAVRMGRWKLIRSRRKAKWGPYLYDLENDPAEKKNLASKKPALVADMIAVMNREHSPSAVGKWRLPADWLKDEP
jgi:arylsulfatase A-like enzyme